MKKVGLLIIVVFITMLLGFFLFANKGEDDVLPETTTMDRTSSGLGITYLPVTRGLSEYYELGVDYGALVTDVIPGSPADQAGLREGDVIVSFNGVIPEEETPLLGMMMTCSSGNTMTMEIWSETGFRTVNILHGVRR